MKRSNELEIDLYIYSFNSVEEIIDLFKIRNRFYRSTQIIVVLFNNLKEWDNVNIIRNISIIQIKDSLNNLEMSVSNSLIELLL